MTTGDHHIEALILKYTNGTLAIKEMAELADWIQESEDNRQEYYRIRNIIDAGNPAFNPDTIDVQNGYENFINQISIKKAKVLKLTYWRSVAAMLVIGVISFALYYNLVNNNKNKAKLSNEQVNTDPGTFSKINLPDGSKVWLNAASHLTFPKNFEPGERHVNLVGEAYFEVQSDLKRPFIVHTEDVEVKATGTSFNVKTDLINNKTSVTLITGKVTLLIGPNKRKVLMLPLQQFSYNKKSDDIQLEKADADKVIAWKEGVFTFRNDSLEEIFSQLMKTYNVEIIIKDPELKGYWFHATFKDETLDEILELIKLSTPIIYKEVKQTDSNKPNIRRIEVYKAN
jgi:transmembrane sensor